MAFEELVLSIACFAWAPKPKTCLAAAILAKTNQKIERINQQGRAFSLPTAPQVIDEVYFSRVQIRNDSIYFRA